MYIYVIRHGKTDWNSQRKLLSYTDISLNTEGIEECKESKKIVRNLYYDVIFSSPLKRTKETTKIINSKQKEVIYDERIIERNAKSMEEMDVDSFNYNKYWTLEENKSFDSETVEECVKRVYEFLDEIREKYHDKNVLIVTHNGICRVISTYFEGFPKRKCIADKGQNNAELKMYKI